MRTLAALSFVVVLLGATLVATASPVTVEAAPSVDPAAPGAYTGPTALPDPEMNRFADDVHKQCGKYALVFRNKDLREDANGVIHAQGQFFIQFQAVGKGSNEIVRFSFSFGVTDDNIYNQQLVNCNEAMPDSPAGKGTGGAYLMYYRSDFSGQDGFFVPILTNNVPDGNYGAAVHAYNAAGNEVARGWAKAVVDNCPTDLPGDKGISAYTCAQDSKEGVIHKDHTQPWAMILPGDGKQTNNVAGLTIEFPEPMSRDVPVVAFLNGKSLDLQDWKPPARDSDLVPLNDESPCPGGQQIKGACERVVYGPGYQWIGEIKDGDILRVSGTDENGNLLERTLHVGAPTSGGTVELDAPELTLEVLNDDDVFIKPGDHHEFNVRVANIGGGQGIVGLLTNITREGGRPMENTGIEAFWSDLDGRRVDGVTVNRGEEQTLKVQVKTASKTPTDHFTVLASMEYDVNGQQQYKTFDAIIDVNPEASGNHQHMHDQGLLKPVLPANETAKVLEQKSSGTPAPGAFAAAAIGLLAVVALRRRLA